MSKQPPGFAGQNTRYVADFTKALASEVRILLAEVGKLRDERRQLQYEISELMAVKSKHGAGGEYSPDWRPKIEAPPPSEAPPPPPPPPAAIEDEPIQARPGWRVVHKRPERRAIKGKQPVAPAPAPPPPMSMPEPPRAELPAWAQWRPNPLLAPTPMSAPNTPPPPPGLFGPPTPPPK